MPARRIGARPVVDQSGDGAQYGGLAATALAHEAEGLALRDAERDASTAWKRSPSRPKRDVEPVDLDHAGGASQAGSRVSVAQARHAAR